jgi:HPt (histidine-containing phosphotransfer) domain-containing protein
MMQHLSTKINIDLTYLHSVSGGDAGFEKILLTSALSDIQMNIDKLKNAWQCEDATEVGDAAHTLKSVMVIAGLPQLENHCKKTDVGFRDKLFHPEFSVNVFAIINGWYEAKPKLEELISVY